MKSICYIVLPHYIDIKSTDDINSFIKEQIHQYYIELEVEPYKKYFPKNQVSREMQKYGLQSEEELAECLKQNFDDKGLENGYYYWITTRNSNGRWDYYIFEEIKYCKDLQEDKEIPNSIVTLDKEWHSANDFGYTPILDFNLGKQHKNNIEPENNWLQFLNNNFYEVFWDYYIAIIMVHS